MTIEINGINVNEIKDVQDVLTAFLALQLETEKSTEELAHILDKTMQMSQVNEKTYLNVKGLINRLLEMQKNQAIFTKKQRTEQDNLINKVHDSSKIALEEYQKLYHFIIQHNEKLQEHAEKAIFEALAKVNFEDMIKEVERTFQNKLINFRAFNAELEKLMSKTDKNIDLLKTSLEKFNKKINKKNILLKIFICLATVTGSFALGAYYHSVFSVGTEGLSKVF